MITKIFKNSYKYFEIILRTFSDKKMPTGRWLREEEYKGSMSNIANKLSSFNNHDHCGGDLCKYPPTSKSN